MHILGLSLASHKTDGIILEAPKKQKRSDIQLDFPNNNTIVPQKHLKYLGITSSEVRGLKTSREESRGDFEEALVKTVPNNLGTKSQNRLHTRCILSTIL